jgi:hypothetical protein
VKEYVLRIRTPVLKKKEITLDELKDNLESIDGLVLKEAEGQVANVEFDGTIDDLYAALPYDKNQLTIAEPVYYKKAKK